MASYTANTAGSNTLNLPSTFNSGDSIRFNVSAPEVAGDNSTGTPFFWTVPTTGVYSVSCYGAAGVAWSYCSSIRGRGAYINVYVKLNAGDELMIIPGRVGQIIDRGTASYYSYLDLSTFIDSCSFSAGAGGGYSIIGIVRPDSNLTVGSKKVKILAAAAGGAGGIDESSASYVPGFSPSTNDYKTFSGRGDLISDLNILDSDLRGRIISSGGSGEDNYIDDNFTPPDITPIRYPVAGYTHLVSSVPAVSESKYRAPISVGGYPLGSNTVGFSIVNAATSIHEEYAQSDTYGNLLISSVTSYVSGDSIVEYKNGYSSNNSSNGYISISLSTSNKISDTDNIISEQDARRVNFKNRGIMVGAPIYVNGERVLTTGDVENRIEYDSYGNSKLIPSIASSVPINHASDETKYGTASSHVYGHTKLSTGYSGIAVAKTVTTSGSINLNNSAYMHEGNWTFYGITGATNFPAGLTWTGTSNGSHLTVYSVNSGYYRAIQILIHQNTNRLFIRYSTANNTTSWSSWEEFVTTGSTNYSTINKLEATISNEISNPSLDNCQDYGMYYVYLQDYSGHMIVNIANPSADKKYLTQTLFLEDRILTRYYTSNNIWSDWDTVITKNNVIVGNAGTSKTAKMSYNATDDCIDITFN